MTPISDISVEITVNPRNPDPLAVARSLHIEAHGTPCLILLVMVMSATGCVISPPIEPEPIAPDRAPRLDFRSPVTREVTVGQDRVTLSVRAFDENPHDFLEVVWLGETLSPTVDSVARQSDQLEEGEIEYRFDVVERAIESPCDELEGVSQEVVTVYVADADLDLLGDEVQLSDPAAGGFLTSATWILTVSAGDCANF